MYQNWQRLGVPRNLQMWYHVATEVEIDVMEFHEHTGQII